jgi:hypothetical protein
MCALVKPKDVPFETLSLQKRIEFVQELKECLGDEGRVVTRVVDLYSSLIDDIIYDICLSMHREMTTRCGVEGEGEEGGKTEKHKSKRSRACEDRGDMVDCGSMEKSEESMEAALAKAAIHFGTPKMLGVQMSGSKGAVDMFGNMIHPVALDQVVCPHCDRKVSSGRFAPHLEKCMGGGRQASRQAKLNTASVSR